MAHKNILITGASSGIGKALALHYAKTAAFLFLTGRNEERLQETVKQVKEVAKDSHNNCYVYSQILDVANEDECYNTISQFDSVANIDLVIANAGISGLQARHSNPARQLRKVMEINLIGVINSVEPLMDFMIQRKHGHIALVSSMAGLLPLPSSPAYSASKSAVLTWGDAIAPKLKENNVNLSVICPGFVRSRITDENSFHMPFFMEAEDAAKIIAKKLAKGKQRIAFPLPLYLVVSLMSSIPYSIKRIILKYLPNKE